MEEGLGPLAPALLAAAAAGIVMGSAAAVAGWPVAARQRGLHARHGRRSTAGRLLPGAEPEPVGGAAAAGPGAERQAGSEQEQEEEHEEQERKRELR